MLLDEFRGLDRSFRIVLKEQAERIVVSNASRTVSINQSVLDEVQAVLSQSNQPELQEKFTQAAVRPDGWASGFWSLGTVGGLIDKLEFAARGGVVKRRDYSWGWIVVAGLVVGGLVWRRRGK